jgi:hypothetical protein
MPVLVEECVDHFEHDTLLGARQPVDPLQTPKQPPIARPVFDVRRAQQLIRGDSQGLHQSEQQDPMDSHLTLFALRQHGLIHSELGGQLDLGHVTTEAQLSNAPAYRNFHGLDSLPSLRHVGSIWKSS